MPSSFTAERRKPAATAVFEHKVAVIYARRVGSVSPARPHRSECLEASPAGLPVRPRQQSLRTCPAHFVLTSARFRASFYSEQRWRPWRPTIGPAIKRSAGFGLKNCAVFFSLLRRTETRAQHFATLNTLYVPAARKNKETNQDVRKAASQFLSISRIR